MLTHWNAILVFEVLSFQIYRSEVIVEACGIGPRVFFHQHPLRLHSSRLDYVLCANHILVNISQVIIHLQRVFRLSSWHHRRHTKFVIRWSLLWRDQLLIMPSIVSLQNAAKVLASIFWSLLLRDYISPEGVIELRQRSVFVTLSASDLSLVRIFDSHINLVALIHARFSRVYLGYDRVLH